MSSLIRANVLVILVALLVAGCGAGKGEQQVAGFVQNYCSMLQDAYARADLKLINQMATEKELKKLFPTIQALTATGNSMKTEIVEFKIKQTTVTEDKATVRTNEKWRYWWIDNKTGTLTKPQQEESYYLAYHLVKVGGAWKVDSITNVNE